MAKYVVPPTGKSVLLVKCYKCKTLYAPDKEKDQDYIFSSRYFEECPVCGYPSNGWSEVIPLWKYNLIAFFRGGFRKE